MRLDEITELDELLALEASKIALTDLAEQINIMIHNKTREEELDDYQDHESWPY